MDYVTVWLVFAILYVIAFCVMAYKMGRLNWPMFIGVVIAAIIAWPFLFVLGFISALQHMRLKVQKARLVHKIRQTNKRQ